MLESIKTSMNQNELHFSAKKVTINDMADMLSEDGWVAEN